MKIKGIIEYLEILAPLDLQEKWDNVGLLVGDETREIKKIMLALDVTKEVVAESIEKKVDLIISHHPIIFKELKNVTSTTDTGSKIINLIKNNIAVYCMHTNLDSCIGGTNDKLFNLLELESREVLIKKDENTGLGRVGIIKNNVTLEQYIKFVKNKLGLKNLICAVDDEGLNKKVRKVGICTGGVDESFIIAGKEKGCDVFVTGDLKYHIGQLAKELGIAIIDGTHYHTENIIKEEIKKYLERKTSDIKIIESKVNGQSIEIY